VGAADRAVRIERLAERHAIDRFNCGQPELDDYLQRHALSNQSRHLSTTYVALAGDEVVGFVTIAPSQISSAELTPATRRGLPRYPLPTMTLARLATHVERRGVGLGSQLLRHTLLEASRMATEFGCIGVRVAAKPNAVGFYQQFGFVPLKPSVSTPVDASEQPTHLILALNRIEDALRPQV
jgi:predicted GNAT family N-acyltransferase